MEKLFDRDISWLAFNARVLQEAADPAVPLFERLRFMAIWSNNLDEFYRVRVAALASIKQLGPELRKEAGQPKRILRRIREIVQQQQETFGLLYRESILPSLRSTGVHILRSGDYTSSDIAYLSQVWTEDVRPHIGLEPMALDAARPFLENRQLYFVATDAEDRELRLLPIPTAATGRFISLPAPTGQVRVTFVDDIIRQFITELWPDARHLYAIKLSRDADLRIDDEYEGILLEKIMSALAKRDLGPPVRLLYDAAMPDELLLRLRQILDLRRSEAVPGGRYHNFSDFFHFPFPPVRSELVFPLQPSLPHPSADGLLDAVQHRDVMLHFPYQYFDHIQDLIGRAAATGALRSICINIYRTSSDSAILSRLEEAARNGVRVKVFIEAKARFDEANNLAWGSRLALAGAEVMYSFPGIKVHAKLLTLAFAPGSRHKDITLVATGNFHEKTARVYTDYALITTDPVIASDARILFDLLQKKITVPMPDKLLISPFSLRAELERLIRKEAAHARAGRAGSIFLKLNNLQDPALIEALYDAGQAGVRVRILVRGICRLIPGRPGLSDNIEARSVVGRYLEHGRAYVFGAEGTMYIGSADWMTRNMDYRIEVLAPVEAPGPRAEILLDMETLWNDRAKARVIDENLSNRYVHPDRAGLPDGHSVRYSHFQKLASSCDPKQANRLS